MSDTVVYCQILSDAARYRQIPPDTTRYHQIPPDTARCRQIPHDLRAANQAQINANHVICKVSRCSDSLLVLFLESAFTLSPLASLKELN